MASKVTETARHDKKPCLVGFVLPVLTRRHISTNMNVQSASI
jgi:hypothetical protein